jgi:hypothetical protein
VSTRVLQGVALLAFVVRSATGAADTSLPKPNQRVRIRTSLEVPAWREGLFNQLRTSPPCYVVNLFKPRASPDAALEFEANVRLDKVVELQTFTGATKPLREWAGLVPDAVVSHWRPVSRQTLRAGERECTIPREAPSGRGRP